MSPNLLPNHREISVIAKGASIVFVGTIIGTALRYIFELLVARNLKPELFGVFFLGFTIFKILERITTVGLNNGVLRYVAIFKGMGDESRIKGTILLSLRIVFGVGAVISFLTIIFSHKISLSLFNEANLAPVLKIFALGIIFTALTEILVFSIQAFQIMKYKVLVRMILEPGTMILFVLLFFIIGLKLKAALFAHLLSLILGTILAFNFLKKVFPLIRNKIRPIFEIKELILFSWPLFFTGFLDLFIVQINTLMLGYYKTSQEVGIYGAAQRTAFLIPIVLNSFNAIFAPMIADFYHRKEIEKLEDLFKTVTKWIFTISLLIFLITVILAKDILSLWGEKYKEGALCLIIICCSQLINCATGSVGFVIMMTGRTIINLINNLAVFSIIALLNFHFIPELGILGAALSLGIAISIINIIRLIEVYAILKIHPYKIDFYKPILAGIGATFSLLAFNHLLNLSIHDLLPRLFVSSLFIVVLYLTILFSLGMDEREKVILNKILNKVIKLSP